VYCKLNLNLNLNGIITILNESGHWGWFKAHSINIHILNYATFSLDTNCV